MVMIYKVLDDLELSLSVRQVTVHCDPSTSTFLWWSGRNTDLHTGDG